MLSARSMELNQLRKYPRAKVDFPVTYEVGGKKRRARAVMLGGNGLLLRVPHLLAPGTEVTVVWGEHPGADPDPDADLGFPRIRATVAPAPYDSHARTRYRR